MWEQITGTGSAFPKRVLTNQELSSMVDTSDEWICSRTGIVSRHIVSEETVASLAAEAARKALENAMLLPEALDQIIVATASAEQIFPCVACEVQAAIGAVHASCFDLNAACSGFLTAYQLAVSEIEAGILKRVLVIGAEAMSHLVNYADRKTCILFGDGAGAVVLEAKAERKQKTCFLLRADGRLGSALTCSSGGEALRKEQRSWIEMDGAAIYKFAVKKVPECIQALLEQANCKKEEISYYMLHQANERIIGAIARHFGEAEEKFPTNLKEHGNISSASIPTLLDQWNREGKLQRGMRIVLAGFGAGLTWGAALLEW